MFFLGPKWVFAATLQSDLILAHRSAAYIQDTEVLDTVAALCQTDKSMGVRHKCVHNVAYENL